MPGNTSIDKFNKCDSTSSSSMNASSVSKLFYGLLNSKSGLDLMRSKKCQQSPVNNPHLRRSFKLLKTHRSESNLPFKNSSARQTDFLINQFENTEQFNNQLNDKLTGSLGDLKMKSNQSLINNNDQTTILTNSQLSSMISNHNDESSPPPTPPLLITSLQRPSQQNYISQCNQLSNYPNYNRELPSLPISAKNEDKRKSISFTSRLSPISDDGGFNSLSSNKRNSISVLNHRNYNYNNNQNINYRNNNSVSQNNQSIANNNNRYNGMINSSSQSADFFHPSSSSNNISNWNNISTFDSNSNLFNVNGQRDSYFSDVDQHLELDYQNINANSNNYALGSQKSDNWSSSTSVLSTYTGITSSSTSDYYTASSETITNSPSLSSLNSAICGSSMNTCNSPPLNGNCNRAINNSNRLYSGSSLTNSNNNNKNFVNNKSLSYMRQYSYPGSQSPTTKLAKSSTILPNTGIAISSLVEKPKRQESASVLYYIVAKDSSATNNKNELLTNSNGSEVVAQSREQSEQQVDKEKNLLNSQITTPSEESSHPNNSTFKNKFPNESTNSFANHNNSMNESSDHMQSHQQSNKQTDLKAIQKSLHEFYLRHRGMSKDNQTDHLLKQSINEQFNRKNLINYSITSNDSACSDSSTVSPTGSPTKHFSNSLGIQLPARPNYLNMIKNLTPEEEQRLNELKANAIYANIEHINVQEIDSESKREGNSLSSQVVPKELRLSFRERCSPFESKNSIKQNAQDNKKRNELKNLNQPNSVKNIAKQFDSLSNINCDLNANRMSPVSTRKVIDKSQTIDNQMKSDSLITTSGQVSDEEIDAQLESSNDEMQLEEFARFNNKERTNVQQLNEEDCKSRIKENEDRIRLFLEYLLRNETSKLDYNKIISHIEEVDKVTKLMISLTNRLKKIENILILRNSQHSNDQQTDEQMSDCQLSNTDKYKHSTSTDSLLGDEKNLFSSILSLSSISLNNLNCNSSAFFASIEMLNSKKNKILDQLEEATQLKLMIERRCKNLNERIICKHFDFARIDPNHEFGLLKNFDFINSMQEKHELSLCISTLKCKEQNANRLESK